MCNNWIIVINFNQSQFYKFYLFIYLFIFNKSCGVQEFKKVFVPRVIPMAEEATIMLRRSHPQTIRTRQWHTIRGGHIVEKEFQEGG